MIHEFVTIHDRFQFEIKQRLVFHPTEKQRQYVMETAVLGADLLRDHENDQGKFLDGESRRALAYCNEYISMCPAYYFFRILELPAWDSGDAHQAKIRTKMIDRLHEEMGYQKKWEKQMAPTPKGTTKP